MFSLAGCSSLIPIISRRTALSRTPRRMFSDKVSDAYKSTIKTPPETTASDGSRHASIPEYDKQVRSGRLHSASEETGIKPTQWQRRFLVVTQLYKSQKDIPEYVAVPTMNRMHNRMRAICITVAVLLFYFIFHTARFSTESKMIRDRESVLSTKR
ncbi:hypothetical protein COOONC_07259 [Cooperia oncophora]